MKIRIQDNSLRLRLTQSEVEQFKQEGRVRRMIRFAPGLHLAYALEAKDGLEALRARFDGSHITVLMPAAWVSDWVDTDRVGYDAEQPLGDGDTLALLVEKDFQCLHKEDEARDEDAYPHPMAGSESS